MRLILFARDHQLHLYLRVSAGHKTSVAAWGKVGVLLSCRKTTSMFVAEVLFSQVALPVTTLTEDTKTVSTNLEALELLSLEYESTVEELSQSH